MAQVQPAAEETTTTPGSVPLQTNSATPGSLDGSSVVEDEPSKLLEEERLPVMEQVQPAAEETTTTPGSVPLQTNSATPGSLDSSSVVEDEPSKLLEEERFEDDEEQALRLLGERWVVEDQCKWTIFEDMEDELQYHRRRSRALGIFTRAYAALHTEYDRLQEGGLGLQDAYEDLQNELKEAVGDVAYWRELAEARAEIQGQPGPDGVSAAPRQAEAQTTAVSKETLEEAEASLPGNQEPVVKPNTREALHADMLQDAKDQAARWRKVAEKRSEELSHLRRQGEGSSLAAFTPCEAPSERPAQAWRDSAKQSTYIGRASTGYSAQRACSPLLLHAADSKVASGLRCFSPQRTPQRADSSDASAVTALANGAPTTGVGSSMTAVERRSGCGGVPELVNLLAGADSSGGAPAATNRRLSFLESPGNGGKVTTSSSRGLLQSLPTPARAWGPGSAPRRCPGLGSPTRKREAGVGVGAAPFSGAGAAASLQQQVPGGSPPSAKPNERIPFEPRARTSLISRQARSPSKASSAKDPAARRHPISLGQPTRR